MIAFRSIRRFGVVCFVGSALAIGVLVGYQRLRAADEPARNPNGAAKAPLAAKDLGKMAIETPMENLAGLLSHEKSSDNPKVTTGLVRWHPNRDAACAAAAKSGKPVLLFHMMGQLDDLFC